MRIVKHSGSPEVGKETRERAQSFAFGTRKGAVSESLAHDQIPGVCFIKA